MKKKPNQEIFFCLWKRRKILLTMKLLLCFILFSMLNVSGSIFSQSAKFDLAVNGKTVKEVFKDIESQSSYRFLYNDDFAGLHRVVSFNTKDNNIDEVLGELLAGAHLTYRELENELIVITPMEITLQQRTVSGSVTDQNNEPLPGVTIMVKGTTIGTVTGSDGNFTIANVPDDATLVFSFVGMETQEILVGDQTRIDIGMIPEAIGLEEVVAVGYGTQRRVNITGSVSTVNFDDELDSRPITNASQALGGKLAGVWVSQNSGKPGSDQSQLRVRGWGTMSNVNPLIIIDGVEGSFDDVNPGDIESISVLRDAASSAIYGSKAANGVILITTKQGQYDETMSISISSYAGVQSLGRRFDMVDNSAELMELMNQAYVNIGSSPRFPDYLISDFRNSDDPYKYPNTNWYDYVYRNAIIHEHNVSVRGGSEQTTAYLSFNYLDQEGIMINTNTERFSIRANLESQIGSRINIGGRMNYIRQNSEEPYYPSATHGSLGRIYDMFQTSAAFIAPYTRDGRIGGVQAIDRDGVIMYENNNPLIDANNGLTSSENNRISINAYTDIKLFNNLNWRTTVASSGNWSVIDRHNETVYGYTDTGVPRVSRNLNREGIEIMRDANQLLDNQVYTILNYNILINQDHRIGAIAGMQLEDLSIKNLYARRSDPPKEGLTQVNAGTSGVIGEGNMNRLRMFSYFGRINYSLADKYLFEANIRADASSRFKEGNRWGIFPGFSAGWRLSEEDFIQNLNVFSNLKIRGSWGKLGNQNIAGYWPYLPIINQTNSLSYSYGGSFAPGAAVTSLVDENITWETSTSYDLGVEAGFFENRITIEANYFDKITEGILVRLPIPSIMGGVTAPFENIGEMTNKGFEFVLNYNKRATSREQIGYAIGFNLTNVTNQVTKFRGGDSPDQLFLIREGFSFQTLYGYKAVGVYQSDDEAEEHMHASDFKPQAGDLKYEDVNNDGRLGFEDKQELGNTIPRFTFGLNPSMSFKGFRISAVLQGAAGVNTWNQSGLTVMSGDAAATITSHWYDAWSPDNRDTNTPRLAIDYSWNQQQSSYWVEEISFIKLKNLQVGYDLPSNISTRLGLQRLFIFANAQNVGSLVSGTYDGYDPERSTTSSGSWVYPAPRSISFGVNLEL